MFTHAQFRIDQKMAGTCTHPVVNVAGTTVAVRVLSSETQGVNQASHSFTQAALHGTISAPTGTVSVAHPRPMALPTVTVQVS